MIDIRNRNTAEETFPQNQLSGKQINISRGDNRNNYIADPSLNDIYVVWLCCAGLKGVEAVASLHYFLPADNIQVHIDPMSLSVQQTRTSGG